MRTRFGASFFCLLWSVSAKFPVTKSLGLKNMLYICPLIFTHPICLT